MNKYQYQDFLNSEEKPDEEELAQEGETPVISEEEEMIENPSSGE